MMCSTTPFLGGNAIPASHNVWREFLLLCRDWRLYSQLAGACTPARSLEHSVKSPREIAHDAYCAEQETPDIIKHSKEMLTRNIRFATH
mmetsp:Transcript_10872/g.15071  ORF Transcript_10872/g.15071 Transcript_10872/m.15071 type:complete len:89 (+) Transcript_10872:130-396(+)